MKTHLWAFVRFLLSGVGIWPVFRYGSLAIWPVSNCPVSIWPVSISPVNRAALHAVLFNWKMKRPQILTALIHYESQKKKSLYMWIHTYMHCWYYTSSGLLKVSATTLEKAVWKPSGTLGRFVWIKQIGMMSAKNDLGSQLNTLLQLLQPIRKCKTFLLNKINYSLTLLFNTVKVKTVQVYEWIFKLVMGLCRF